MKKFMILAIAAMALLVVSCQKEKDEELPIFTAHADNGGMKTDMVGNFIHWNNTDQVKVFGDFGYAIYGVSPRGNDPTWATLSPIENHGITGFLPYRFVYPASMAEGGTANNVTLFVNYPAERSIGDAPLTYFPMYGESDHRDVAFRNLGGLVKLVMPEIDRQIFRIRISTDEPNNGKYRIGNDYGLEFTGVLTDETKCVTIQAGGRTFAQGDCVYIAMPANEYHHFTIEIIADGQHATKVAPLVDVLPSAITTITLSNFAFEDNNALPVAMLMECAFSNTNAQSIVFHYNYTDVVTDAERIDSHPADPDAIPVYKKIVDNACHVYTPASEVYAPANSSYLFAYATNSWDNPLMQIDFGDGFNTSNVTDMSYMFHFCRNLTSLDVSSFNTSNVTDMTYMFGSCENLTSLDLSSFNTSNVTRMCEMFSASRNLVSLNLSSFNTSNVTDMHSMFWSCSNLTSLDLSSFNTSNVTNMNWMFGYCQNLTSLDLSSFNTSNVTDMGQMFDGCENLTSLDLSSFSSNSLSNFSSAFRNCTALQSIRFSSSFSLSDWCSVWHALEYVGTIRSTTIKCNSQTKDRLMNTGEGSRVVWDLY